MIKVSLKEILKSDVGILNKYFLVTLILVLLTIVGYTSYALFSYEEISSTSIRLKYTGEQPMPDNNLSTNWKNKTSNETSYVAIYTYNKKTLPTTYECDGETYTKSTEIDVSEQGNNSVILGEYTNGSNMIAVIGQDGVVMAPVDSSHLFNIWYWESRTSAARAPNTEVATSDLALLDLTYLNTSRVINMKGMFMVGYEDNPELGLSSLTILTLGDFNTSNVTNMSSMFSGCSSLTSLDVSSFDTSNVTNMYSMFSGCSSLTSLDLSSFNTSNVTNMGKMFLWCSKLTKVTVGCNWEEALSTTDMFSGTGVSSVTKVCDE